jgi:hypothetical protein
MHWLGQFQVEIWSFLDYEDEHEDE